MPGVDVLASIFNGANAAYMADMYARWVENPANVDASFGELFNALNDEARFVLEDASGASWAPRRFDVGEPEPAAPAAKAAR
jgi:2-oxoglutarate dehydrogenase E1 component